MRVFRTVTILAVLGTACGVPEAKYKAAVSDAERNMKEAGDQKQRADEAEAKAADLSKQLSDVEAKSAAAAAEAEAQRKRAETLQEKSKEYESLAASLDQEIKAGRIKLSELQGKVTVRMGEKVLFPSGSATINAEGKATLKKIAEAFADVKGRMIRVEGHTDNIPIRSARFPSNWELSSARAIAVVRYMQELGIDPKQLAAAGYGEFQPIADNSTPEGRADNRRIEISLAAPL
jgi:chemotaxis protein MotB